MSKAYYENTFYEKTPVLLAKGHKYISLGLGRLARNPR